MLTKTSCLSIEMYTKAESEERIVQYRMALLRMCKETSSEGTNKGVLRLDD